MWAENAQHGCWKRKIIKTYCESAEIHILWVIIWYQALTCHNMPFYAVTWYGGWGHAKTRHEIPSWDAQGRNFAKSVQLKYSWKIPNFSSFFHVFAHFSPSADRIYPPPPYIPFHFKLHPNFGEFAPQEPLRPSSMTLIRTQLLLIWGRYKHFSLGPKALRKDFVFFCLSCKMGLEVFFFFTNGHVWGKRNSAQDGGP